MSKLYKNYMLLKLQDSDKFYLFKCGIFYVFIDNDAYVMSKILGLKLTDLNPSIKKCGFPVNAANKYFNILKTTDYEIEIVDSDTCATLNLNNHILETKYKTIVEDFLKINIDELSISQAFDYLHELQNKFKEIQSTSDNNHNYN